MFDYQESRVNRLHTGFEKEKEGTSKNLGLVVVQCNGIAACAYSLKVFTAQYIHCCSTLLCMVCK